MFQYDSIVCAAPAESSNLRHGSHLDQFWGCLVQEVVPLNRED